MPAPELKLPKDMMDLASHADYWRHYLANDRQSEWAARARRSLKFCEMQINLVATAVGAQKDNPDQAA
jgi:hypothetical protein